MKNTLNQEQQKQKNQTSSDRTNKKDDPFITNPDYTTTGDRNNAEKNKKSESEWSPSQKFKDDENPRSPNQYNR
ncbi:MAG: hypothetical protein J0L93_02275 [Deltaproteobacteria bacterium]|nr:hypothetical protein [Deltaproteobacteria bacterium]